MSSERLNWAESQFGLRSEMGAWIRQSIARQQQIPWQGGHDEGTFTSAWCGYYLLTGDEKILDFMRWLRDGYLNWSARHFVHGYPPQGEAHHGTETHCIFLTRLWHLDKQDEKTIAALEDAAHHVGNWIEGVPAWYDWDHHGFRSWHIGTETVEAHPPFDYQVPDHFKFLQFVLPTYLSTGEERYLNVCRDYADRWCHAILQGDELPGVLFPLEDQSEIRRVYGEQLSAQAFGPVEDRVELHVAGGSLDTLLDLYQLTGERHYAEAVRRVMPIIVEALADPLSRTSALLVAKYRALTGDRSYDNRSMEIICAMEDESIPISELMIAGTEGTHPMGIGRRRDEIKWGYRDADGMIRQDQGTSPAALTLAYQITGKESFAAQAFALAARRLHLARSTLRDGREHGCAGNTISAVTAGHGRAAGVGDVTSALPLLTLGAMRFCGGEDPALKFFRDEDVFGLPESVAVLFESYEGKGYAFQLYADAEEEVALRITPGDSKSRIRTVSLDGAPHCEHTETYIRLRLPSRRVARVRIEIVEA